MAKTRLEKEQTISYLEDQITNTKGAVLVDYKGLKVKEIEELRRNLREKKVGFAVVKNSLAEIVFKRNGIEIDPEVFNKPLAMAFGKDDEVSAAKEIDLFAKKHEALEVLAGILDSKMVDAGTVKRLAALPSKEMLYGRLVGSIASPLSGMVNVLAGNLRGLVNVLNGYKEKIS